MAYNNQSSGNRFGKPAAGGQAKPAAQRPMEKLVTLLRTGLFKPKSDKTKAVASIVTEISSDLKAGTRVYIDLYKNSDEEVAGGKPPYVVMIKEAPEAKRA
jgi:hypothetical protein